MSQIGFKHNHATKLLKLLHEFIPFLHLGVRTLLKSMRTVGTKNIHPGQYHYFGIVNGVKKSLSICKLSSHLTKSGYLSYVILLYVDGIPLTESTKHFGQLLQRFLFRSKGAHSQLEFTVYGPSLKISIYLSMTLWKKQNFSDVKELNFVAKRRGTWEQA